MLFFSNQAFVEPTIRAVCWTLLHSLWQGVLIAILAGFVIMLTRQASARIRYNLLVSLFCCFLILVGLTFWAQLASSQTSLPGTGFLLRLTQEKFVLHEQSWPYIIVTCLNNNAHWVVGLWSIVITLETMRIFMAAARVQSFRYQGTRCAPFEWHQRMQKLAEAIGLRQAVRLAESTKVTGPAVIGFFKPLILVPIGFFVALSPEQVEAVLLHELGHIKRRDYMINFFQCIADALFFFNPAFRWLSAKIRQEREHCCDDIAVHRLKSGKVYVEAMVYFQAVRESGIALFFWGTNNLLHRVLRIANKKSSGLSAFESLSLTFFALLFFLSLHVSFAPRSSSPAVPSDAVQKTVVAALPFQSQGDDSPTNHYQKNQVVAKQNTETMQGNKERMSVASLRSRKSQKTGSSLATIVVPKRLGLLQPTNGGEAVENERRPPNAIELTTAPSAAVRGQPEEFRLESEEMQRQAALAKGRSDLAKQEHFKMKEIHEQIRASLYAN
jgi:beta-lactamase regulating signal transducer with metallopeptidase domain